MIAAMEANHPNLTTQKTLYVEISLARDRAELVTDDKAALREQLEAVTGERIVALEAVDPERVKVRETVLALAAGTANVSYRDVVEAAQAVASSDLSMSDLM